MTAWSSSRNQNPRHFSFFFFFLSGIDWRPHHVIGAASWLWSLGHPRGLPPRPEAALRRRGSLSLRKRFPGARTRCWRLARAGAGELKAGAMVEKEEAAAAGGGISEEEAAQYDRQIRLWGLEAQKR